MSKKWTDAAIKARKLSPGKTDERIRIGDGLYLRLRDGATGTARTFEYRAQVDGKRRILVLGPVSNAYGLSRAQEDLQKLQGVAAQARIGEADHPVLEARYKRHGRKSDPTFAELLDDFIADRKTGSPRKDGKPVRDRTIELHRSNFDADIRERIGDAKVSKITREALEACVKAVQRRGSPGQAAQVYRTLRALVRFAIQQGRLPADPMVGILNPKPHRAPRSADEVVAATDRELRALFTVLDKSNASDAMRMAIEFALLTGARPSEVRLATWSEINLKAARWRLPAERTKSDRAFEIHLSEEAIALLRRAKKLPRLDDSVFPGPRGIAMEKMAMARALSRLADRIVEAGGRKLRPHDLRRTTRTMMSRIGVPPHIAERCLGHLQRDPLERIYDGHDHREAMNDAWDRVGAHIASLKSGGAEVVALRA